MSLVIAGGDLEVTVDKRCITSVTGIVRRADELDSITEVQLHYVGFRR